MSYRTDCFKLFEVVGFVFGVIYEKMTLSKMFAKIVDILYNDLIRLKNRLKKYSIFRRLVK